MNKILIAYASKYHSTAEIAKAIANRIREESTHLVDLVPVQEVDDLSPYQAVILGSAVYCGQWMNEAATFLKDRADALTQRMVWLFSSGPIGNGDVRSLLHGWEFPAPLIATAERIKPRDITVFHGSLDPSNLNVFERTLTKMIKTPTGDYRDWTAIHKWATQIAQAIKQQENTISM